MFIYYDIDNRMQIFREIPFFISPFHCLSAVLWPEEGDFPENLHPVVCVIINKRSVESFMCLDLILLSVIGFECSDGPKDRVP